MNRSEEISETEDVLGDVRAVLDDVFTALGVLVLEIVFGAYGEVPDEVSFELAGALGRIVDELYSNATAGKYDAE